MLHAANSPIRLFQPKWIWQIWHKLLTQIAWKLKANSEKTVGTLTSTRKPVLHGFYFGEVSGNERSSL
jgi:hypothetical protein